MPQRNSTGKVSHNIFFAIDIDAIDGRMEEMSRYDYTCIDKQRKEEKWKLVFPSI